MLRCLLPLLIICPAYSHVVSMSTSEAVLAGARLDFELRMPLYEVTHVVNPETALLDSFRFSSRAGDARLLQRSCRTEQSDLVCTGLYLFEHDVDQFHVQCKLASITVPNHVHLLRARHGERTDQAAFDASFTAAAIRFRPPTAAEIAARDASAGFWRAIAGLAQLLFLAALVLAARTRTELAALIAMFIAGQVAAVSLGLATRFPLSPRFIEAAAALTIAYLAVEILLLPQAGQRWLVSGILGILHGVYFDMLLAAGDYRALPFISGVIAAEIAVAGLFWLAAILAARLTAHRTLWFERGLASVLFVTGLSWFLLRLRS
jgi:hypothetical protein